MYKPDYAFSAAWSTGRYSFMLFLTVALSSDSVFSRLSPPHIMSLLSPFIIRLNIHCCQCPVYNEEDHREERLLHDRKHDLGQRLVERQPTFLHSEITLTGSPSAAG